MHISLDICLTREALVDIGSETTSSGVRYLRFSTKCLHVLLKALTPTALSRAAAEFSLLVHRGNRIH